MDNHFLVRLPKEDIVFLLAGHMDVVPTLFELRLYKVESDKLGPYQYHCAVKDCPVTGTDEQMVNLGRFPLCRAHGGAVKRAVEQMHAPRTFKFFGLDRTIENVSGSESDGRIRQARAWLEGEPALLQAHKAAQQSSRGRGPSVDLGRIVPPAYIPQPALVAAAVAIAAPASSVAASAMPVPTILPQDTNEEMDALRKKLEALKTLEDLLGPAQVEATRQAIMLRMEALNSAQIETLRQQLAALEIVDGMLPPDAFAAAKQRILDAMAALGVADPSVPTPAPRMPVAVPVPASVPAPTPPAAPAASVVAPPAAPAPPAEPLNKRLGLEVRPGDKPLPHRELTRRAAPQPMQVICIASGGTLKGNPFDLAATVGYFGPADYQRVEDCFVKLGDIKRMIFDHVYPHAAPDADDTKLRDFRSAEFKAARTATFQCKLCAKKLEALEHLRKAVIEFGKAIWPDRWQGRRDEEANGTGTLKCADHPSKGAFGLLFDRVTGQPRPQTGDNNVCGKCHKSHVNETEGAKRDADRHARQVERGKTSADAKGAAGGGGGKNKKGKGGKK